MNVILEVLQFLGGRIGLRINIMKSKLLRLEISENEEVALGNKRFIR